MPWPKQCPNCKSRAVETTKRTFRCKKCGKFVDKSMKPDTLEYKTFKKKSSE